MNLSKLITDDRAVSPVIGVILMVAITVILAAVIGTFVLGLGDSVSQNSPSASFDYEFNSSNTSVVITHAGGDSLNADQISVGGLNKTWESSSQGAWETGTITAGSATGENEYVSDEVRVIWTSDDGSSSQTIGSRSTP
ncbi:type IV pilin [Haloparvum sedimenti]|uniref:type IV pilin n=1 Tax=Haloparvum sedimenti TaxID=1678448 RepID=UPI00071E7321|nr:type IV pilin N-terminal domain-containing protein [Haloparvum sedimenti]